MAEKSNKSEDNLVQFMDEILKISAPSTSEATIYKVPRELREGNEGHFRRRTISIGPLHAGTLSATDELKKLYFKRYFSRLPKDKTPMDIRVVLKGLETTTRECYKLDENSSVLSSEEFLKMMLLDGCFIVELLLSQKWSSMSKDDLIMGKGGSMPMHNLQQDLLKIENQIPFFVLCSLWKLVPPEGRPNHHSDDDDDDDQSLVDSALGFFQITMPTQIVLGCPPPRSIKHLLDLIMITLFPPPVTGSGVEGEESTDTADMTQSRNNWSIMKTRSASELAEFGIKFAIPTTTKVHLAADIKFKHTKGVLEIPSIEFQGSTTSLFWNLLIWELCSGEHSRVFSSYIIFMDRLINTEKDVQLLLRSGVLQTRVNDMRELVSLFNNLSANVITMTPNSFRYRNQLCKIDKYCDSGPRPLHAYLVRNYYEARWDVLNSSLLFILTCAQTLFAVLSYSPKHK